LVLIGTKKLLAELDIEPVEAFDEETAAEDNELRL
jgi:hypothetical protein